MATKFELVKFRNKTGVNVTFSLANNESEIIESHKVKPSDDLTFNPKLEDIQTIWIVASDDGHSNDPTKQLIDLSKSGPLKLFIESIEMDYVVGLANGQVKCSFK